MIFRQILSTNKNSLISLFNIEFSIFYELNILDIDAITGFLEKQDKTPPGEFCLVLRERQPPAFHELITSALPWGPLSFLHRGPLKSRRVRILPYCIRDTASHSFFGCLR